MCQCQNSTQLFCRLDFIFPVALQHLPDHYIGKDLGNRSFDWPWWQESFDNLRGVKRLRPSIFNRHTHTYIYIYICFLFIHIFKDLNINIYINIWRTNNTCLKSWRFRLWWSDMEWLRRPNKFVKWNKITGITWIILYQHTMLFSQCLCSNNCGFAHMYCTHVCIYIYMCVMYVFIYIYIFPPSKIPCQEA